MKLIRPNEKYLDQYRNAIEENFKYRPNAPKMFSNPDLIINSSFEMENGINLKPGYVKATHLWLIDGDKFIGEIGIRHELTPDLLKYGGNIGYEIRWSECGKGYGTKILNMALEFCKSELKLNNVLITCDKNNIASRKVIENNGGVFQDEIINVLDRGKVETRRYWIKL